MVISECIEDIVPCFCSLSQRTTSDLELINTLKVTSLQGEAEKIIFAAVWWQELLKALWLSLLKKPSRRSSFTTNFKRNQGIKIFSTECLISWRQRESVACTKGTLLLWSNSHLTRESDLSFILTRALSFSNIFLTKLWVTFLLEALQAFARWWLTILLTWLKQGCKV